MLRNFRWLRRFQAPYLLNEVLSLNAQEYAWTRKQPRLACFLNEVLSLNAQEYVHEVFTLMRGLSSMKS